MVVHKWMDWAQLSPADRLLERNICPGHPCLFSFKGGSFSISLYCSGNTKYIMKRLFDICTVVVHVSYSLVSYYLPN